MSDVSRRTLLGGMAAAISAAPSVVTAAHVAKADTVSMTPVDLAKMMRASFLFGQLSPSEQEWFIGYMEAEQSRRRSDIHKSM